MLSFISGLDTSHASKLAEKWGPVPRILLKLCSMPEEEEAYQVAVKCACKMASQNPNAVMLAITTFDGPPDLGSSEIFFVKPRGKDIIHRGDHFVFVPTRWLLNQLGEQLILEADNTRVNFFNIMSGSSQTRSAAGWIFEEHVHCHILSKKCITINWHDKQPQTFNFPHLEVRTNLNDVKPTPSYWRPKK